MREVIIIILMIWIFLITGCNAEKNTPEKINAVLLGNSFWVIESENIPFLEDAITRRDTEYLNQLILERKVFEVNKDTKVTLLGAVKGKNHVLISFNEGRYTNKNGFAHSGDVVPENKFPEYLENQKQKKFALIRDGLTKTEKYFEAIASSNLNEITRLSKVCLDCTNEIKTLRQEKDAMVVEMAESAINIINARDLALSSYKGFIEYSEKTEIENPSSKKRRVYDSMRENYRNNVDDYCRKAEQARQEFRNRYGY